MAVEASEAALGELSSLERYLGLDKPKTYLWKDSVPVLRRDNNNNDGGGGSSQLAGLATVASHLARESGRPELLGGDTAEQRAVVRQWLEYRVTELGGLLRHGADNTNNSQHAKTVLKDLNSYLADKVYVAGGDCLTLADVFLYHGVRPLLAELSAWDMRTYLNVARWFDHVQRRPGVRDGRLPPIVVPLNFGVRSSKSL